MVTLKGCSPSSERGVGRLVAPALAVAAALAACGGGTDEAVPPDDATAPPAVVNGFVETSAITRDAFGEILFESSKRVELANDRLVETGRNADGTTFESLIAYDARGDLVSEDYRESGGYTALDLYEHDERGLLRRRTSRYGGFTDIETFEYDAAGRLLSRQTKAGEGGAPLIERTEYTYGADGLPVSARERIVGGATGARGEPIDRFRRKSYAHDADGRRVGLDIDEGEDGSIDLGLVYEYDAAGNMIRNRLLGADGAVLETREYGYEAVEEPVFNRWLRVFRYFS